MKACVMVHGVDNFIGARLVASLANEEWSSVLAVRGDDGAALSRGVGEAQAIAHCIVGSADHIERSAASLYGLLSASKAQPRVVHLSSMTVYGSASGSIDESCDLRADLGPYSAAQRRAEQIAANASQAVILRAGAEYGPTCTAWSGRVALWLRAHRLGDLGEYGDGVCNLVYIDDLVAVLRSALREPGIEGNAFNVAAREKITWNDYFIAYAIALGAVPVRRIGARRLRFETRIAAPALRVAEMLGHAARVRSLRIPPPIPPSLLRLCRQEVVLSAARVERTLRPQWTPLQQGLRRAAEWYS